jgi:hypothetical protein
MKKSTNKVLKQITRIEIDEDRNEAFVNAEFNDDHGFFNFGKWYRGDDATGLDEDKVKTLLARDEAEIKTRRENELNAPVVEEMPEIID